MLPPEVAHFMNHMILLNPREGLLAIGKKLKTDEVYIIRELITKMMGDSKILVISASMGQESYNKLSEDTKKIHFM